MAHPVELGDTLRWKGFDYVCDMLVRERPLAHFARPHGAATPLPGLMVHIPELCWADDLHAWYQPRTLLDPKTYTVEQRWKLDEHPRTLADGRDDLAFQDLFLAREG